MRITPLIASVLLLLAAGCQSPEQKVANHLKNAREFLDQDQPALASVELRNVLQIDPNQAEAYYMQAQILERNQDWRGMYGNLQRTLELAPEHVEAHRDLAKLYMFSGELPQAKQHADKVLMLAPKQAASLALMGAWHLRSDQPDAALQYAREALMLEESNLDGLTLLGSAALLEEDFALAEEAAAGAEQYHPESPVPYLMRIRTATVQDDDTAVVHAYEKLIALNPESLAYRQALASHHLNQGDTGAAEQVLRQAVEALPEDHNAKLMLARFLGSRSTDDAIAAIQQFLAQEPSNTLRFELAGLYQREGRLEDAGDVYRHVLSGDASNDEATMARTRLAALALDQEHREEAEALIDEVLAQEPSQPDALLLRAYIQLEQRETDQAIGNIRIVLRNEPENDKALTLLGEAYLQQYAAELAEASFKQAIEVNPTNVQAAKRLASIYILRAQFAGAEAILRPMAENGRGDDELYGLYIQSKLALQDWTGANAAAGNMYGEGSDYSQYITALTLQERREHKAAAELLRLLVEKHPTSKTLLATLAHAPWIAGDGGGTEHYLRGEVEKAPNNVAALELLAEELLRRGKFQDAQVLVQQALQETPRWLAGFEYLARVHVESGDLSEAKDAYRKGLEQQPKALNYKLKLAMLADRTGDELEAEALYRELIDQPPTADIAANNLAMMLSRRQETRNEAISIARRFTNTQHPLFADTLGWIYVLNGDLVNGSRLLEYAAQNAPSVAEVKYHLAVCRHKQERFSEAIYLLREVVELVNESPSHVGSVDLDHVNLLLRQLSPSDGEQGLQG